MANVLSGTTLERLANLGSTLDRGIFYNNPYLDRDKEQEINPVNTPNTRK